ncbi:MAG: hypothetical protein LBN02_08495 [Oscillospiraceae bacterium]|jgi:hypothetical protein|nr:hypothetical protein [Oscillospiraceae bacterium]
MRIVVELILAAALFGAMTALWRASGRVCFTPVPKISGAETYIVIALAGDGDGLAETVSALRWLNNATCLNGGIVIVDRGLTDEGRRIAEILARDGGVSIDNGQLKIDN